MRRVLASTLLMSLFPAVVSVSAGPQAKDQIAPISLKLGDAAPDFTLLSDSWKTVKLGDFRGKKNVLLAVYVLAFTGG